MPSYTTIQGDMWDVISLKNYGSELYTDLIIAANMQHKNTAIFGAGMVLAIPELPTDKKQATNLPPWRR